MELKYSRIDRQTKEVVEIELSEITGDDRENCIYVMKVVGDILGDNRLKLDKAIKAFQKTNGGYRDLKLLLDMEESFFIDSAGVGILANNLESIREYGGELVLVNISEPIESVLTITGTKEIFKGYHSDAGESLGEYTVRAFLGSVNSVKHFV